MNNSQDTIPEFLEPCDCARLLDVMPSTVHRLTATGALAMAGRTVRGTRLYTRTEVERLAAERRSRFRW